MNILSLLILFALKVSSATELKHELIPFSHKQKVEVYWAAPEGKGPYPVMIFAHPYQARYTKGAIFLGSSGFLEKISEQGFVAVAFSQSGHGASTGKPDHCGKNSQEGLRAVIRYFRSKSFVDPRKIVLRGSSMGATLAALVATQEPELGAVILESGVYDIEGMMTRHFHLGMSDPEHKEFFEIINEYTGEASDRFVERSIFPKVHKIRSPVLIINGAGDSISMTSENIRLHREIAKTNPHAEIRIYPFSGHAVHQQDKLPDIRRFLQKYIGK